MRYVLKRVYFLLLVGLLIQFGCGLGEPLADYDQQTGIRFYNPADQALSDAIKGAKKQIKLSLNRVVDPGLIIELNNALARGVSVAVVLDSKHEETSIGLGSQAKLTTGNSVGKMNSNFAIIDQDAWFFSDADLTNQATLAVRVNQEELLMTLDSEFYQMNVNGAFGSKNSGGIPKQKINHQTVFDTSDGRVEVYFIPQNEAITYLSARMKQAKKTVDVVAKLMDSEKISDAFVDIGNSGLPNYFCLGDTGLSKLSAHSFIMGSPTNEILEAELTVNCVFIDRETIDQTLVMTTFPWDEDEILDNSDGIVLFISGVKATEPLRGIIENVALYDRYYNHLDPGSDELDSVCCIAAFNVLRLGENKKAYPELAQVIIDGGFDIVGLTELMVGEENSKPSIGDSMTNIGPGNGVKDLARILSLKSGDTWKYHVSATAVGSAAYSEYYGYVFKYPVVSYVTNLGFYSDTADDFTRNPYGALFKSGKADFTLVMQHAIYGSSSDVVPRQLEASKLIDVYNHFRSKALPLGDRDVIIAGDFNLPADDLDGFATLYNTVDKITWAIHPSTATTIGDNGNFVSAYDNIFYSTVHSKEVLSLNRGAYRDWVAKGDYAIWGSEYFKGNNFTFANTYISDHVPVYITFDTSYDDD